MLHEPFYDLKLVICDKGLSSMQHDNIGVLLTKYEVWLDMHNSLSLC